MLDQEPTFWTNLDKSKHPRDINYMERRIETKKLKIDMIDHLHVLFVLQVRQIHVVEPRVFLRR